MIAKFYYLILTALLFSLTACGSNSDDNGGSGTTTKVITSYSPQSLTFDVKGGSQTITVQSNGVYKIYIDSSTSDWLSIDKTSGDTGSTTVTVTAKENKVSSETPRTSTVTLQATAAGQKEIITVSQNSTTPEEETIKCPIEGYTLVWNDEFDEGTTLYSKYWTHEVQNAGWVNKELQNYVNGASPDGSRVTEIKDGRLHINCLKDKNGKIYSGRVYANVSSGYKYGYIEASIKLPKGKGTWPAWWMMPSNNNYTTNPWPGCGEIDIMEEVGYDPNVVVSTIHCNKYNNGGTATESARKTVSSAQTDLHTYGLEWTPTYMTFYVDNVKLLTYKNDGTGKNAWPFDCAFYPILNLAWGGSWGGLQGVDESVLPATMEVEYVRVFQKK